MKYEDRYDMMDKNEKEIRIREYLSGELSKAEEREFNEWLDGDADAQRIFKERVKQYHLIRWTERWEAIDDEMARKRVVDRVRRHRWRVGFMRYAAVIAVIVVTGLTIWNWPYRSTGSAALTLVSVPAANVPILKLADGKEIPVSPRNMEIIPRKGLIFNWLIPGDWNTWQSLTRRPGKWSTILLLFRGDASSILSWRMGAGCG